MMIHETRGCPFSIDELCVEVERRREERHVAPHHNKTPPVGDAASSPKSFVDVLATHPNGLLQAIAARRTPLPADTCERIVALIRRDHTYHAQRRRRPH